MDLLQRFATTISTLIVAAALALLVSCSSEPDSPEARVRAVIDRAENAAEERDSAALRSLVSTDYLDGSGNNKKNIENLLRLYLLRHKSIHLLIKIQEIKLPAPGWAEVSLSAAMAGTPLTDATDLGDFQADFHRFELVLMEQDGGEWKVTSAEWQRADLQDFL